MSEIATRGIPPELAKAGLLGPVQTRPFPAKSPFSRRRTRLEWVSGHGDHPPSSRDHGARGSQDPPWPMRRNGLSETWTTIAFLSKEALGLRLVPEHSFGSQNVAFQSAFFAVSEIRPSWVPPQLAKWGVAGACANQAFYCRITFLPEGEQVWCWSQATETTHQAAGPTQPEAAQTIVGPMGSRGLREN